MLHKLRNKFVAYSYTFVNFGGGFGDGNFFLKWAMVIDNANYYDTMHMIRSYKT